MRAGDEARIDGDTAAHRARVDAVATAVARAAHATTPAHIAKGGVHHVVPLPTDQRFSGTRVDTSALCNIVSIDPVARRAVAEPGVTFEQLVRATLPHGLAPAVVPELRGITVGGAVAGCSIESMSWRLGGFHDSCTAYEVVTGDGRVLRVGRADPWAPAQHADLFEALHGSYGTLGVLTEVTFDLVPAGPLVEVTYDHHRSFESFRAALVRACERTDGGEPAHGHQLVDAIVHGPDHYVLCLGRFRDHAGRQPSDYSGVGIYHRSTARLAQDLLTTEDYFFRYDTECHWLTATVPPLEWPVVRRLGGRWLLGSTNLITLSNRVAPIQRRILRRPDLVCDVFIPADRFEEFFDWYAVTFDFWPLWVVPYRPRTIYPWIGPSVRAALGHDPGEQQGDPDVLFIDAAIYGAPNRDPHRDLSVELEEKVFELGGLKTLIGRNHYSSERFWQTYDRPNYEKAKAELDPTGLFPDLYDKLGRVD